MTLKIKNKAPKHDVIELTAAMLAGTYYEAARNAGLKSEIKTPKLWAKKHFEKFVPLAVNYLLDILSRNDIAPNAKEEIYEAILERTNDPELHAVTGTLPAANVELILNGNKPAKPVIINSIKFDPEIFKKLDTEHLDN